MNAAAAFVIVGNNISSIFQISENFRKADGLHSSKIQDMLIKGNVKFRIATLVIKILRYL